MLEGKVALVSGASRGIGKAIALDLARQGAYVVGTATSENGAASISSYFQEAGLAGEGKVLNVASDDSIKAIFADMKAGKGEPNILVNNAAITQDNIMLRMKEEEWDNVITTNLTSVFKMSKAALRSMVKARWGRIISIGSIVGSTGNFGQANYSAAKAGVVGFSKSLAVEVASRNVTVNAIAPGFIATDMTGKLTEEQHAELIKQIPAGEIGKPEDIANMATFLASDKASYITGQTLHVNGGMFLP